MKYLGDCYDSLDELVFVKDKDGNKNIKLANEMIAKDKERLMLSEEFSLEGEVEKYLNNLTEAMRLTLKLKMQDGYQTAGNWEVDKPRHDWLFYYPAQTDVTVTQIYWTEESEAALEDLSGGQEVITHCFCYFLLFTESYPASLIPGRRKAILECLRCAPTGTDQTGSRQAHQGEKTPSCCKQ